MTSSLIHAAFDPLPYVLFSAMAIVLGVLLEMNSSSIRLLRHARTQPQTIARQAFSIVERSRFSLFRIAKR
jgi:hypothetical protein